MEKDYKKLYEEALERAKIKRDEYMRLDGPESYVPQDIEYIFPELAESEDEKIRKWIINEIKIKHHNLDEDNVDFVDKAIAWLGKQGEQKPNFCHHEVDFSNCSEEYRKAYYDGWNNCNQQHEQMKNLQKPTWSEEDEDALDIAMRIINNGGDDCASILDFDKALKWLKSLKERMQPQPKQGEQNPTTTPKFKAGDWVINEFGFVMQIIDVQDNYYVYMYKLEKLSATIEQMEDSCHLWSIGDANDGDVLVYKNEIFMIKSYTLWHKIVYHCCYDGEDLCTHSIYDCWKKEDFDKVHPATREQCDLLFQKMRQAGYEWDIEKKELREIKSDSVDSEKDDKVFKDIYEDLHAYYGSQANANMFSSKKELYEKKWGNAKKWLEEHKEHWKPTREQLFHIQGIIEECGYSQDWLESLYNDLKKL